MRCDHLDERDLASTDTQRWLYRNAVLSRTELVTFLPFVPLSPVLWPSLSGMVLGTHHQSFMQSETSRIPAPSQIRTAPRNKLGRGGDCSPCSANGFALGVLAAGAGEEEWGLEVIGKDHLEGGPVKMQVTHHL